MDIPSHNDNAEVHGAAIHNLAVRVAARRYVKENANIDELSASAAVEALCLPLVQESTLPCIFAKGGLNYNILHMSRSTKQQVLAFMSDPDCNDPPKELASFMKVHPWGVFDALSIYYHDLMPLFQLATQFSYHPLFPLDGSFIIFGCVSQ